MTDPTVCAILLTKDRPEMARQAVESFRRQTYEAKRLYVYDTGRTPCTDSLPDGFPDFNIVYHRGLPEGLTIGALRNRANWWGIRPSSTSSPDCDIIVHFDDDDLSHPNRIAEQVALLQSTGADCVGYREVLFWDCRYGMQGGMDALNSTWLYSVAGKSWAIGSSFCYWRRAWERNPFPDLPKPGVKDGSSEDVVWRRSMKVHAVSALPDQLEPRLICRIHGGNSQSYEIEKYPETWRRAEEWDERVRRIVEVA